MSYRAPTAAAQCEELVSEPPHYLHQHRCSRRWCLDLVKGDERVRVCRQHARWYERKGFVKYEHALPDDQPIMDKALKLIDELIDLAEDCLTPERLNEESELLNRARRFVARPEREDVT